MICIYILYFQRNELILKGKKKIQTKNEKYK